MRLRAGVPPAGKARIRSRLRIVGTIGLHAVGDGVVAAGRGHHDSVIIVILVVVITRRIDRSAIAVALRRDRAADHSTGDRAGDEAAATAVTAMAAAISGMINATATELHGRSAAATAKFRGWRAAAAE